MKKLLVLTTGGTIASVMSEHGLIPALSSEELISFLPETGKDYQLTTKAICKLDSTNITPDHWLMIMEAIRADYDNYDGFVICHGTDTMAYTASALSYLIQCSPKPIVITGAQKPIGSEITDAKANLRDSILYAGDEGSSGIAIVFDGKAIRGTRSKKTKTHSFAAFSSINYPFLAEIVDGRILRYMPVDKSTKQVRFYDKLNTKVFMLKMTPGMQPDLLEAIFETYDCIIIESFGVGGLPESMTDEMFRLMEKYNNEKVLIMTTQVTYEGSNIETYEVGRKLKAKCNILEAKDMTLESVLTKIMWILATENQSWDEIQDRFYSCIEEDTLY